MPRYITPVLLALALHHSAGGARVTMEDLWLGRAHFAQVGEIALGESDRGGAGETASWFAVRGGRWYVFSRQSLANPTPDCRQDHTRVIVRESRDQGKTWSPGTVAVSPGSSRRGDGCAVLDGSSYYDAATGSWHMLSQCLDRNSEGGWALCHYRRDAASPRGRFIPDPQNPVISGGALWSRICALGKKCPTTLVDEGTPDIVGKVGGSFVVTFHGLHPSTGSGYRGVARTQEFVRWNVEGPAGAVILGPPDCQAWLKKCAGFGQGSTMISGGYVYTIAEYMEKGLVCSKHQEWAFALFRTPTSQWPSLRGRQSFRATPFIRRRWPDPETPCALGYARWLIDGDETFLIYEDWEPGHAYLHRRLLKLLPGGGPPVQLK